MSKVISNTIKVPGTDESLSVSRYNGVCSLFAKRERGSEIRYHSKMLLEDIWGKTHNKAIPENVTELLCSEDTEITLSMTAYAIYIDIADEINLVITYAIKAQGLSNRLGLTIMTMEVVNSK